MNCGSSPGMGKDFFSSPRVLDWFWTTPNLLFSEYFGILSLVQRMMGHGCDNLPLPGTEVKIGLSSTNIPHLLL